jgi:putative ABC transport system permease protein
MPIFPRLRSLWNTIAHKDRLDRDLDDELRAAMQTLEARYVAEGLDARAAREAAIAALAGRAGLVQVRDEIKSGRIGAGFEALLLDLRYAWRGLSKARGFTAVLVMTLALGIGANTAIFSVVHAMLLQPLPYRDPDRLAFIWLDRGDVGFQRGPLSGPDLRDLREGSRTFSELAAIWATGSVRLGGDGEPEQLRGAFVTANFFQLLGADAALGRTFRAEDNAPGARPTVLLGWDLFQRRFGGDASLVGRQVYLNEEWTTVIGVMPRSFRLLLPMDASVPDHLQVWVPFWHEMETGPRGNLFLRVVGRLRPDATIAEARADVTAIAERINREHGTRRGFTPILLHDDDVREIRGPLLALFAGVGLLLMIACVNVASLLVARAASRVRETALRLALGASRGRLLRQSLIEGLVLTLLGAVAGVIVGDIALRGLLAVTPETLSRLRASQIDPIVLLFTLGVAMVWGVLFSLAPTIELFRTDPARSLHAGHASGGRHTGAGGYRIRTTLVIVQVALSVVLLVSAALLARAFGQLLRVDLGYRTENLLTFRVAIEGSRYPTTPAVLAGIAELQRQLAATGGVLGVGAISHVPYDDLPHWSLTYASGTAATKSKGGAFATARTITPGFMETLGVELLEGRLFTADDRDPKNALVIIDDIMAARLWPNRSAIGQPFMLGQGEPNRRVSVVGVVRHLKLRSLVSDVTPQIFLPFAVWQRSPMAFVVHTSRDAAAAAADIRATVARFDPQLPIFEVRTLDAYVDRARAIRRFTMLLAGVFAATALMLTCIGVYGVLAYVVAIRRREFGVRRALGADGARIIREVMGEGLGFAAIGGAIGVIGALIAGQLLESQLYAVHARDPVSFGAALILIVVGALLSCWLPAYRAVSISPMDALRSD